MAGPKANSPRLNRAQLLGRDAHYLLDLRIGGQVFHLARENVLVTSATAKETFQYEGIVDSEIAWQNEINLFADSADVQSIALSVVLPFDFANYVERGYDPLHDAGELSLWVEGTNYEDRIVLMRGTVTDPRYGAYGEPLTCSLQSEFFEDRSILPGADQVIDETTWPLAPEGSIGMSYPFVFGTQPTSGAGHVDMSPAYLVRTAVGDETLVVAGHVCGATSVTVRSSTSGSAGATVLGLSQEIDGLGNAVTVIGGVGVGLGALAFTVDDEFWITWDQGTKGAKQNKQGTGALSGAGDLIEYLLSQSTLTVDIGRMATAIPFLNQFQLAGYIAEGVSAWEWITANLSPILPMSVVNGPDGVYVVPWKYNATIRDAVDRIDVGIDPTVERDGPVQFEGALKDIVNRFVLKYAIQGSSGGSKASILLSAERNTIDPKASSNVWCAGSKMRYGERADEQESTVIYAPLTAGLVTQWWSRAKTFPTRVVEYLVGYDRAWLEIGNVVTLTDPELSIDNQVCLLEGITYREDGNLRLRLRIVHDPSVKFNNKG